MGNNYINRAGVLTSLGGILSGFTFAATITLLQLRTDIAHGDVFLVVSGSLTIVFISATMLYAVVATWGTSKDEKGSRDSEEQAQSMFNVANNILSVGFLGLVATIIGIIFVTNIIGGAITLIVAVALFAYLVYKDKTGWR